MNRNVALGDRYHVALMGLRALAPIIIFTSHWADELGDNPLRQSQLSIDFFFAVEGFLAAETMFWVGPHVSPLKLFGLQLLKIYPLYVLGIVASVLVNVGLTRLGVVEWTGTTMREAVLWNTLFVPVFVDKVFVFPLNPPTWAIALEIYAFGLLCLTRCWCCLRTLIPFVFTAAVICTLVSFQARNPNMGFAPQSYWGGFPRCLFGYFFGVLLYHLVRKYGSVIPRVNPILVWLAFVGIMFISTRHVGIPLLLIAMPVIMCLAVCATNPSWLRGFSQQAGRIAYGIYLLSYPIMIGMIYIVEKPTLNSSISAIFAFYAVLLTTVVLSAYGATLLVEVWYVPRSSTELRSRPGRSPGT